MGWIELHIVTDQHHAEILGEQLTELGAQALTFRDAGNKPVYEPKPGETPTWNDTLLVGLFDDQADMSPVLHYIETQQQASIIKNYRLETLADQAWERTCLNDFKPLQFGKRLCICPSWETPPNPNHVNIILDPGLAFGTGTSPTTALCLEWLDDHVKPGDRIIDYGCGSGILAIAALKLGGAIAHAVDYDPQALLATRENGDRNALSPTQLVVSSPETFKPFEADIVIANILAQSLIELAPYLASLTKPKGHIVLSGILVEQSDAVIAAYSPWFTMQAPVIQEEWVRLAGLKKSG